MRYRDGAWSVNRDPDKASYWLKRAAAAGNPLAVQALAEADQSSN
jgi:TPR repeat protein